MPIITLTTDFGSGSAYVAQMKGVMLSINSAANVIDITHSIAPQDVFAGALALADAAPLFPEGSIHVAVVDPGVGTERRIVHALIDGRHYVAPDNGVLTAVLRGAHDVELREVSNRSLWRPNVSHTFHGRDIMAPVAAHLSLVSASSLVGPLIDSIQTRAWPQLSETPTVLRGEVIAIDSFGNLITNISEAAVERWSNGAAPASLLVTCGPTTIAGLVQTYGQAPGDEVVALFGWGGLLEIAIVGGNAAQVLSIGRQATVSVSIA